VDQHQDLAALDQQHDAPGEVCRRGDPHRAEALGEAALDRLLVRAGRAPGRMARQVGQLQGDPGEPGAGPARPRRPLGEAEEDAVHHLLRAGGRGVHPVGDLRQRPAVLGLEHRADQRILARIVVVEGALGHRRGGGDRVHAGAREAGPVETGIGGRQDAVARRLGTPRPARHRRSVPPRRVYRVVNIPARRSRLASAMRDQPRIPPMADAPTIRAIRARPVRAPMARPVRTASGAIPEAPLLLLDVVSAEGPTGRAYVFGYTPLTLAPMTALVAALEPSLVGKAVAPVERMREAERTFRLLGRQGLLGMVLSGLDMAYWDLLGQAAGRPVAALLGGEARPVAAYDSYGLLDPAADRAALERSLQAGFRAIKIKLGGGDLAADLATVAAVRDIIGPEVRLMVDYNQSLTAPEAVRRVRRLAAFDIAWVEEPVPAEDLAGHALVRAAGAVPVQTGENWWFPEDMARAIAAGASDFAMPDLMKIGGVTGWMRAAGQAEAASLPLSSHLFVEASAHVLPVSPTCHWLEFLDVAGAVLRSPTQVVDGRVTAAGPGLGMAWDEAAVARHAC